MPFQFIKIEPACATTLIKKLDALKVVQYNLKAKSSAFYFAFFLHDRHVGHAKLLLSLRTFLVRQAYIDQIAHLDILHILPNASPVSEFPNAGKKD